MVPSDSSKAQFAHEFNYTIILDTQMRSPQGKKWGYNPSRPHDTYVR